MAYNNMFPMGYQQVPYYNPMQMQNNNNANNNGIIWVQGEAGAKSYLVAPNTTVQLWDSEAQVIYLKSADASGMPSIKVLDYKIREQSPIKAQISETRFATIEDNNTLTKRIDEFEAKFNAVGQNKGGLLNEHNGNGSSDTQ